EHVFRAGERRVIARLLAQPVHVLATGGGAFMDPATRELIACCGVSLWLRADLDVLVWRGLCRSNRPLLKQGDPRAILDGLIERAGREMLPLMRRRHAVVVSDEIVARHYLAALRDSLSEAGIAHHSVLLPPGEETKDLAHFGNLAEDILAIDIERGSMLVALG